jgi:hypothetical protein
LFERYGDTKWSAAIDAAVDAAAEHSDARDRGVGPVDGVAHPHRVVR